MSYTVIQQLLGLGADPKTLTFSQVSLRATVVFFATLIMVRIANRRFIGKLSAFDTILGFIMASMLARAVNGTVSFFPTLGAGFVLVAIHALLARLSFRFERFGDLIKGNAKTLVRDGKPDWKMMGTSMISEKDLMEEARLNGPVHILSAIEVATLERNGQVSVVPKD